MKEHIEKLAKSWKNDLRWKNVQRDYSAEDVVALRGSLMVEYTLARQGAEKFWKMLHTENVVAALGAMTGNQAIQQVEAGMKAIYCSGWQVAGDANTSETMYPDQSLYPVDSVPSLVRRINNALMRTDQIHWMNGERSVEWFAPIIADAEAGFGGNLNAFELTKHLIIAGAAAVHFEDQLSSAKKCGHLGGKVLVPTQEAVNKLISARLAADVLNVPTLIVARTDANAAGLITSDVDERDHKFITEGRSAEGFFNVNAGIDQAIDRGLSYAPYADLIWCETSSPSIEEAKKFADAIKAKYPDQLMAYNCSPSFNWKSNLSADEMKKFREELAAMGYKFQFITLAGWHALNNSMFELAKSYMNDGMYAYSQLQEQEFENEKSGYRATKHQSFVGTGYFDKVQNTITNGKSSTVALKGSTENDQFYQKKESA
ncbi:MAG: isocitrate lyase [Bacteroidia bacterium]|nr:isocitrate lyase [Bacteroidia bacterium]